MKLKVLCCLIWILSACSPVVTALPTSGGLTLPDLVVSYINVAQVDENGRCLAGYKISATILNQGQASAANVEAVEKTTGQPIAIDKLEAGQSKTVYLSTSPTSGNYIVVVDPQNLISESNETNNNLSFLAPTPTLVLECMKSPTVASTPMPPLASTPQPNVTPAPNSLDGLIYVDMGVAQLWQINTGQQLKIMDGVAASFSQDGSRAVYEQDGDIWLSELTLGSSVNITHSSDRIDRMPQLWQSTMGQKIVFDSLSDSEAKRLYMSNLEGTEVEAISSTSSYSPPGLDPTGQSIAFDENGSPMIYLIGTGTSPFLTQPYNYQPETGTLFTSPSISPNGALLSWWVCKDGGSTRKCDLVLFTRAGDATYKVIHSYSASINMLETWLPNPIWSSDGQWIAFQTYSEVTPYDVWIMHPDGGEAYRIGLALNPVWNPDSRHLAYTQRYPQTVSTVPTINIIETGSFNTETTLIPFGSIPVAWFGR